MLEKQQIDPERKKQLRQHINGFIRNLRKARTLEELGGSMIQLTKFRLADDIDDIEGKLVSKLLKRKIERLAGPETSEERLIVYGLISSTFAIVMFTKTLEDKVKKFEKDVGETIKSLYS